MAKFYYGRNIWGNLRNLWDNYVVNLVGSGLPASANIADGIAGTGSVYTDVSTGFKYINTGTLAAPEWTQLTTGDIPSQDNVNVSIHQRFTTAQVNAGAVIVPAPGADLSLRLVGITLVAIGGTASGATTVDITAIQSTAGVKLVAVAVAALVANTPVTIGDEDVAVLAGGVSFNSNDPNTAISIGHTGGNLATATAIDVILTYAVNTTV